MLSEENLRDIEMPEEQIIPFMKDYKSGRWEQCIRQLNRRRSETLTMLHNKQEKIYLLDLFIKTLKEEMKNDVK